MQVGVEAAPRHQLVVACRARRCGRRAAPRSGRRSFTVETRWETRKVVRWRITSRRPAQDLLLGLGVDRARARRRGSGCAGRSASARASAVRCFCPPESVMPRSPTKRLEALREVGARPWPSWATRRRPLARAARRPPSARPKATFSRTVVREEEASPAARSRRAARSVASGSRRARRGRPRTRCPGGGSKSRGEQAHERALAGAGGPDDRHRATRRAPRGRCRGAPGAVVVGEGRGRGTRRRRAIGGDRRAAPRRDLGRRVEDRVRCGPCEASPRSKRLTTQPSAIIGQCSMAR